MEKDILYQKDYAISVIRFLAMLSIVLCHFLQACGNEGAWWFNVGVQIFLCMSGFLYGKKYILDSKKYIIKSFGRILPMYYTYLCIVLLPLLNRPDANYSYKTVIELFFIIGVGQGLNHLWFIRHILLCYLITPLLQKFYTRNEKIRGGGENFSIVISS